MKIIKEEKIFIITWLIIIFMSIYPLNYYISTSGGIFNIEKRITIDEEYKTKGTFNISYVNEIKATPLTFIASFIIPNWDLEKVSEYKLDKNDTIEDINNRLKIDMNLSTAAAIENAFNAAGKPYKIKENQLLIYHNYLKDKNNLKTKDQILQIDNKQMQTIDDISKVIEEKKVNDIVTLTIKRDNKTENIKTKIYEEKGKKRIGVYIISNPNFETTPKVKIKFNEDESGPSGGLITALAIYNKLTKEDITKGKTVVGTGTMESNSEVGEIGGVKYKLLGAAKQKADIFLVPEKNYKEAIEVKKKNKLKIKIIKVKTLNEAIKKLKEIK